MNGSCLVVSLWVAQKRSNKQSVSKSIRQNMPVCKQQANKTICPHTWNQTTTTNHNYRQLLTLSGLLRLAKPQDGLVGQDSCCGAMFIAPLPTGDGWWQNGKRSKVLWLFWEARRSLPFFWHVPGAHRVVYLWQSLGGKRTPIWDWTDRILILTF